LPPAVVYGPSGEPLYSWRVLVLPFIEEENLYREFHLDEPWDSAHNIRLLERMPRTFAAPGHKRDSLPAFHTVCHVFVGPSTAFEGPNGVNLNDFPDGASSTLLLVEAGEPVPWTKPEEIAFDPRADIHLRCIFHDGYRACLADGSRRFIRKDIDQAKLRAAITRNGGEKIGLD
jgi:hypothetical protein